MKKILPLVVLLVAFHNCYAGQYFYWVDFSPPLNQVGQLPATSAGPRSPSQIVFGSPTVVSSFGQLTNQALLFKAIAYQQIQFDLRKGAPDYFLDFDFVTRDLNPSRFAFTALFDTPSVQNFSLHGLGAIHVPGAYPLPGWTDNDLHHVHISADLVGHHWTFQLDDRVPAAGPFVPTSGDVQSIRMNLSTWIFGTPDDPDVQVAVDHVRIGTSAFAPAPAIDCPSQMLVECTNSVVTVSASIQDASTSPLTVTWSVDSTPWQTNTLPPGAALTPTNLALNADLALGEHLIVVSASNGEADPVTCSTDLILRDSIPPIISRASANPDVLWPPNGQMVPVRIDVEAEDNCGTTTCKIVGVQGSESELSVGRRRPILDWQITGDLTVNLRAARLGDGQGRVYTIIVECEDTAGNTSQRSVNVAVPHG